MNKLALMPVVTKLEPVMPAAFHEREAALYLRISIHAFRDMVRQGAIPYVRHPGRVRRLFVKQDLDEYLHNLVRCRMSGGENPRPTEES